MDPETYAKLKAEILAELRAEFKLELAPPIPELPTFKFQVKTGGDWTKLEKSKDAFATFSKWYASQKDFRHPKHAFNWLLKHHGAITIERTSSGEFLKAAKKSWQV